MARGSGLINSPCRAPWRCRLCSLRLDADMRTSRQARQQVNVPHCFDRLLGARAVPIIPNPLAGRCAAACSDKRRHPLTAGARHRLRFVVAESAAHPRGSAGGNVALIGGCCRRLHIVPSEHGYKAINRVIDVAD